MPWQPGCWGSGSRLAGCRGRRGGPGTRVGEALQELARDPAVLVRLVEAAHSADLVEEARQEYRSAQRRLDALQRQEQRLARLYLLGEWDEDLLLAEQQRIAAEKRECEERLCRAGERLRKVEAEQRDLELVSEALAVLRNAGAERFLSRS